MASCPSGLIRVHFDSLVCAYKNAQRTAYLLTKVRFGAANERVSFIFKMKKSFETNHFQIYPGVSLVKFSLPSTHWSCNTTELPGKVTALGGTKILYK